MSELARKLIEENKRSRAPFLDLGNCGLAEIPAEVAELEWLESLSLSSYWWKPNGELISSGNDGEANTLSDLVPIAGLVRLRALHLVETKTSDLSPLSALHQLKLLTIAGTQVSDLLPLRPLTKLTLLVAWRTPIRDLEPLRGMRFLRTLSIAHTEISDLAPLADMHALKALYASGTQVEDLSALADLPALRAVSLDSARVTDLSPLRAMLGRGVPVGLTIDVGPASGTKRPAFKPGVSVGGCPLVSPPPEIVKQGREAVLNYFAQRDAGDVDHLYEAKLLILGEGGSGKTSLVRRLYQPKLPLPGEEETTRGIEIHRHEFTLKNGRRFRLNVWDFGGQEIYHATHQFFLTHRSLYLLLDDTRKDQKSVSDEGFRYWLDLVDVLGGHSPVLLFQNEKGGRSKAIDIAGIKGRYDNVADRWSGNLEHADAADTVRDAIEFFAANLGHIGEELPARWIAIRADVEARAAEVPYVSRQEYFDIYARHIPFDRAPALHLSQYLHDLGVFLHFQDDPLLARTVILQNGWATEAVFRILDDEIVKARFGRFTAADCERLWRGSAYADMHPELLALMQRFELCYVVADSTPPTWLAPQLLPPAKPAALSARGRSADDLVVRYHYDFLPKGMISRLTVRMHRFVRDPELAWITGVLFERDDTSVLVELLPAGDEIELRARGPERTALISAVAADLEALNESFRGLAEKVDKRVPCICARCRAHATPHFYDQRALRRRVENRRLTVECPESYDDVDVPALLDGVRPAALPDWATATPNREISIFLASSSELAADRDAFDLRMRRLNDRLRQRGVYLRVVRWEYFLDAMSATRLQDEYDKAVRECDVFVSLFFTKTGRYTAEEFTTAHEQFTRTGRPFVYTYFKNGPIMIGDAREEDLSSLRAFQARLKELGHFPTGYDNVDQLLAHFGDQIEELLAQGL